MNAKGNRIVTRIFEAQDEHVLNAGIVYEPYFEAYYIENLRRHNLHIQLFKEFEGTINNQAFPLAYFLEKTEKKNGRILVDKNRLPVTSRMKSVFQSILQYKTGNHAKSIYLESKIIELLILQIEQYEFQDSRNKSALNPADIEKIHQAKIYLEQNIYRTFSISELSRFIGLNEFKLKRGFKELFNSTVFGYLTRLRMNEARRKLLEENKTVSEVADILGYSEPHHFSAAFKRFHGYLPGQIKGRTHDVNFTV